MEKKNGKINGGLPFYKIDQGAKSTGNLRFLCIDSYLQSWRKWELDNDFAALI